VGHHFLKAIKAALLLASWAFDGRLKDVRVADVAFYLFFQFREK
jgi:hypothetical protein